MERINIKIIKFNLILNKYNNTFTFNNIIRNGDWGLGIGPNPQSPIPNPQSPIPHPPNNY